MFLMRFTERAYVNYTAEDVRNSPNSAGHVPSSGVRVRHRVAVV